MADSVKDYFKSRDQNYPSTNIAVPQNANIDYSLLTINDVTSPEQNNIDIQSSDQQTITMPAGANSLKLIDFGSNNIIDLTIYIDNPNILPVSTSDNYNTIQVNITNWKTGTTARVYLNSINSVKILTNYPIGIVQATNNFATPINIRLVYNLKTGTADTAIPNIADATNITGNVSIIQSAPIVISQGSSATQQVTFPADILFYVPITITNNQVGATGNNFQQLITLNSSVYQTYEAANLMNVCFQDGAGNFIHSWLESGETNTSTVTNYWVEIPNGIGGNQSVTIYMCFANTSTNLMNTTTTGAEPTYSGSYGQYDSGLQVFAFYQNFQGVTLPSGWSLFGQSPSAVTINNGFSVSASGGFLETTGTYPIVNILEWNQTNTSPVTYASGGYYIDPFGNPVYGNATTDIANLGNFIYSGISTGDDNGTGNKSSLVSIKNAHWLYVNASQSLSSGIIGLVSPNTSQVYAYVNYTQVAYTFFASDIPSGSMYILFGTLGTPVTNTAFTGTWVRTRVYPPNGVMPVAIIGTTVFSNPAAFPFFEDLVQVGGQDISLGNTTSPDSLPVTLASDQTITLGQATSQYSVPVVFASDQSAIPVSGSFTLPSNFNLQSVGGTAYNLILGNSTISQSLPVIVNNTAAIPVSGSFSYSPSGTQSVNVTQWAGTATVLGQAAMTASIPVVIASNQSSLPITFVPSGTQSVNIAQVGNNTLAFGQQAMTGSIPVVIASNQSTVATNTRPNPYTGFHMFQTNMSTVATQLATHSCTVIIVKNDDNSSQGVYVGDLNVTTGNGFYLAPSEGLVVELNNTNIIWGVTSLSSAAQLDVLYLL